MKLSNEINDLLIELINIESVDSELFASGNMGLLCHHLLELYGKTTNQKSHELIISIIDKSGYSLFSPRVETTRRSDRYDGDLTGTAVSSEGGFELDEDDFMDLLPINGYFH